MALSFHSEDMRLPISQASTGRSSGSLRRMSRLDTAPVNAAMATPASISVVVGVPPELRAME